MAHGDSPYDYLNPELRADLEAALEQVPEARRYFEAGRVPKAREALDDAGFATVAGLVGLSMPYKYDG